MSSISPKNNAPEPEKPALEIKDPSFGKAPSYWATVYRQFKRSRLNRLGLWVIVLTALVAIAAPWLANSKPIYLRHQGKNYFPILATVWPFTQLKLYPELRLADYDALQKEGAEVYYTLIPYSPNDYDLDASLNAPSRAHWLGTDEQGRDVLSRLVHGSRVSLSVGLVAVSLYVLIGIFLGSLAGYFGGRIDMIVSRVIEIVMCFPTFFLILTLLAITKPSIYYIMVVIGLTGWTGIARLVRGEFFKLRDQDFIVACRSQGMKTGRIIARHILPNALAPVMVSATFGIASAVLVESSLSFLGFGVQPPTPSWGELLSQSRDFISFAWWLTVFPGLAIFVTITSYNLAGEGLRDAIDPRLKQG